MWKSSVIFVFFNKSSKRNKLLSRFILQFKFLEFSTLVQFFVKHVKKFAVIVAVVICFQFTDKEGRRVLSAYKQGAKPNKTSNTAKSQS